MEALTSRVLPSLQPAPEPAPVLPPAPAPVDDGGVPRCVHGLLATEPCGECGRRLVGDVITGGMIGGAVRGG